jgi:site-specific DNA-methyltransferase (adenine-specific)
MQERPESNKKRLEYGLGKTAIGNFTSFNTFDGFTPETYDHNLRNPSSVQYFNNRDASRGLHPTQKPELLMEYLIKTYTLKGDTVLDFTMGSGTTGVAALRHERDFIGIELDSKYFEIAEKRLNQELGKESIKEPVTDSSIIPKNSFKFGL